MMLNKTKYYILCSIFLSNVTWASNLPEKLSCPEATWLNKNIEVTPNKQRLIIKFPWSDDKVYISKRPWTYKMDGSHKQVFMPKQQQQPYRRLAGKVEHCFYVYHDGQNGNLPGVHVPKDWYEKLEKKRTR